MNDISRVGYTLGQELKSVDFFTAGGQSIHHELMQPVVLFEGRYSVYSLCRLCVSRMPLRTLEKVIMTMVLDETECGLTYGRSYADLGRLVGKCAHSAEDAVAHLRRAGLLVTSRIGRSQPVIALSCEAFVRWAESKLSEIPQAQAVYPVVTPVETPVDVPVAKKERTQRKVKNERKRPSGTSVEATRKTTDIPSPAAPAPVCASPAQHDADAADKPDKNYLHLTEDEVLALPDSERELYFAQYRQAQIALFTQPGGSFYPGTYLDENGLPHFDWLSGYPCPPFMAVSTEPEPDVDPSGEIAATLAARGEVVNPDADDDTISFGSETEESDMNPNVRINPDI